MDNSEKITFHILTRLVRRRIWKHKHTSIHNLSKGIPDSFKNDKLIKKVISNLLKQQILLSKPTHYGLEIIFNIKKKKEIEEMIKKQKSIIFFILGKLHSSGLNK